MSDDDLAPSPKSIRNIQVPAVKLRPRSAEQDTDTDGYEPPRRLRSSYSKYVLWGAAALGVVAVGVVAMLAFRPTTITVVPRSQAVTFDQSVRMTAYPAASAASGALAYTVQTVDLEDSEVVPTTGTEHADSKASGTITVYNTYSAQSVRLIKSTRFASPSGLIFRVPNDVVVPGKKGSVPGQVAVTVIADASGDSYNVASADHWTVPGLKSSPAMYAGVYASSAQAMSGGFSGDRPSFAPGALEAAIAEIRGRLADKALAAISVATSSVAIPGLMSVMYQSLPSTNEAGGGARVHESAHVEVPVFSMSALASSVAQNVSADASANATLTFSKGFVASFTDPSVVLSSGQPFQFSMSGTGMLVWNVDTQALTQALSGRDTVAFQTIITGFPAIQEAHARFEPFWNSHFPTDPSKIKVELQSPAPSA